MQPVWKKEAVFCEHTGESESLTLKAVNRRGRPEPWRSGNGGGAGKPGVSACGHWESGARQGGLDAAGLPCMPKALKPIKLWP
jgi:hypothetical protein